MYYSRITRVGPQTNLPQQGRYHRGHHRVYRAYASSLRAKEALEGNRHDIAVQLQEEDEE